MKKRLCASGLVLLAGLAVAGGALADPAKVAWPDGYRDDFTEYFRGDRLSPNDTQAIRIFASPSALEGAGKDGALPYGAVLVAEIYGVELDADGQAVQSALGRRIPDQLKAVAVMERLAGTDGEYPEELAVGDWEFALFAPDGTRKEVDVSGCRACHNPLNDSEYVWSYEHLPR